MSAGEEYVGREPASAQFPFEEVDVDLLAFVERYATGAVKWDIIAFFGENPYTSDTARSIAQRIGRSLDIVLPELIDLAMVGLLERIKIDGAVVFQLTQEQALRQTTFNFVRHFRGRVRQALSPLDPSDQRGIPKYLHQRVYQRRGKVSHAASFSTCGACTAITTVAVQERHYCGTGGATVPHPHNCAIFPFGPD